MRSSRLVAALVALAFIVTPATAQLGGGGCPQDCYQVVTSEGVIVDSFCASADYGLYLTCKKVQWCWRMPGLGTYCEPPNCTGDTCMYV